MLRELVQKIIPLEIGDIPIFLSIKNGRLRY